MPAVRIGVVTSSLRRPIRQALQSASQAGADGVEIDLRTELPAADLSESAVRQLRKLLDDLRLSVGAVCFPTRRGFGDPRELDRRVAATQAAMTAARKLGAKVVVLRLGDAPAADDPQRPLLEDSLQAFSRHADHVGVRIALQASGDQLAAAAELLDALPSHLLGLSLDPAGLIAEGVDLEQAMTAAGRLLSHVYAADAVRDLSTRGAVPVELGRGSVEWPEMLGRLEEHDYRDWLFLKLREGAGPDELENAVAYLRAV